VVGSLDTSKSGKVWQNTRTVPFDSVRGPRRQAAFRYRGIFDIDGGCDDAQGTRAVVAVGSGQRDRTRWRRCQKIEGWPARGHFPITGRSLSHCRVACRRTLRGRPDLRNRLY